ncbi:MAG: hypothetical protein OES13_01650 [Acidimicrobiia bacterium]|nr:hypothetical protein [Acidimicrobiia bacterium]
MRNQLSVGLVLALVTGACSTSATDTSQEITTTAQGTTTAPATTPTTALSSTTTATTATTAPVLPTNLPPVEGTSLADVVAYVQAELDFSWSISDNPPGVLGAFVVTCDDAAATPAAVGDVFACPGLPQTDDTLRLDPVGIVMMVVGADGAARWLSGTDIPDNLSSLEALYQRQAGAHFCRELAEEAGIPFDLGYKGAVIYWFLDGMPDRMDADRDGVPCETVFFYEEVLQVWQGTDREALLEDPRAGFQFAFLTDIAPDGSSITLDYAEFLTGEEANDAAIADGDIPQGETVPNDYYIRNVNPRLRTFPVSSDAIVALIGFFYEGDHGSGIDGINVTTTEWASLYIESQRCIAEDFPPECADLGGDGWGWYGGGYLPYWVLIDNGTVVEIEEQYLP